MREEGEEKEQISVCSNGETKCKNFSFEKTRKTKNKRKKVCRQKENQIKRKAMKEKLKETRKGDTKKYMDSGVEVFIKLDKYFYVKNKSKSLKQVKIMTVGEEDKMTRPDKERQSQL